MEASPAARIALIIDLLCQAVAARAAEGAFASIRGALSGLPLVVLLWSRLRRAATRLNAIAASASSPKRRRSPHTTQPRPSRPNVPHPDLPRRRAWLLAPVPEAAAFAAQLRHVLDDQAMQAILAADPRYGRILRPLCRSLGITPPPALRRTEPPRPSRRTTRTQRPAPTPTARPNLLAVFATPPRRLQRAPPGRNRA